MINAQAKILNEVANPQKRRNDIALSYAACMRERDSVDWPKINAAIAARWSTSGLSYIKGLAWKHRLQ